MSTKPEITSSVDVQSRSTVPTGWMKVGLAILPGLFIVGTRSGLFGRFFGLENWQALSQNDLTLPSIALGIFVAGLIVERRPAVWSFPALGMLLFWAPVWILAPFARLGDPRSRFWQVASSWLSLAVLAAVAALAAYQVFRREGLRIPRSGWVLLGLTILMGMVGTVTGAITDRNPVKWASFLAMLPVELWSTALLLLPAVVGLPLARRSGLLAGVILVAFEFILVDEILDPTYRVNIWAYWEPSAILDRANVVLSYLPALFFLVVTPIWVFRSRSTRGQIVGLLLPPLIALVGTDVIETIALRGTSAEYPIRVWLTRSVLTARFLIVLVLAAVMYDWLARQGPTEESNPAGRESPRAMASDAA